MYAFPTVQIKRYDGISGVRVLNITITSSTVLYLQNVDNKSDSAGQETVERIVALWPEPSCYGNHQF